MQFENGYGLFNEKAIKKTLTICLNKYTINVWFNVRVIKQKEGM